MKSIITKFLVLNILLIIILFIFKLMSNNNVFHFSNTNLFEADNVNSFIIEVEPIYDGFGVYYYEIELENGECKYYHNSGYINNQIELINKKKLTDQEIIKLRELISKASVATYLDQGNNNYYKISNGKYIYTINEVQDLEQILEK